MSYLSPIGNEAQIDANGNPLSGGKIFTYLAGTTTATATYTDSTGGTPQANPIILNSHGLPANPIWLGPGVAIKMVFTDSTGVSARPTVDNILGINDPSSATAQDQWVSFTGTPTYISATSFSVAGDQTGTLQANRRLKTANSGGTVYSTISASTFGAGITTVVVVNDASTLDSGLSSVSYGLISYTSTSAPKKTGELIGVQTFTVTGVYTPTLGTTSVVVECQAPGGGSGGCAATAAGQIAAGAAGGGGGYGRKRITSAFSGVTVTIGAAGTAGAAGAGGAGGTGGTTSFGALISCTGGGGGPGGGLQTSPAVGPGGTGSNPLGGTATGADYSRPGSSGEASFAVSASAAVRGGGGDAFFGAGGARGTALSNQLGGVAGSGYGGGASGPVNINAAVAAIVGNTGAPGIVIVYEYA